MANKRRTQNVKKIKKGIRMIKVIKADSTGHTVFECEVEELGQHLGDNWVFVNNTLVDATFDFNTVDEVTIMPQLIGGHNKRGCNRPISNNKIMCFRCIMNPPE